MPVCLCSSACASNDEGSHGLDAKMSIMGSKPVLEVCADACVLDEVLVQDDDEGSHGLDAKMCFMVSKPALKMCVSAVGLLVEVLVQAMMRAHMAWIPRCPSWCQSQHWR